jgi:DNA-binding response OmpR family regulator
MLNKTQSPQEKVLRILIVDDDVDDRQLIALAYKEADLGHDLHFVKNGEELMTYLRELHGSDKGDQLPDLILLDLNMPKKDGRVALREIRSNDDFNDLNIIVLSTTISSEDYKYLSDLGVRKCITKPCGFYELVDIVKALSEELIKHTL